jgi:hypothetical protein
MICVIPESEKKGKVNLSRALDAKVTGRFVLLYKSGLSVDRGIPSGYNLKNRSKTEKNVKKDFFVIIHIYCVYLRHICTERFYVSP